MNEPERTEWQIRCAFNGFCKRTLKNESINAHKELKERQAHEINFSDLTPKEENQLYTCEDFFAEDKEEQTFFAGGKELSAKLIADAIHSLPEEKRRAVLHYYFFDMRYAYKYTDTFGKPQFVYAWKLVPTDKTPKGKCEDKSLREKVKEIQKDLDDGIAPVGKKMTVCQLYEKHIRNHANVRHGTKQGRQHLMRIIEEDTIGAYSIENVKMSDAKEWALRMKEKGYSFKTIGNHKRSLKTAFYSAIQDDCIKKNPFDFHINTVIEDDTEPKIPLSPTQEESLLSFVKSDKVYYKYYDEPIILLGTGLRISELCGLTVRDIDFENRTINVDHQLQYSGKKSYRIEIPKTDNGIRKIPMSDRVLEALQRVLQNSESASFFFPQ
ncbi:integrase DNA-binding domain-containing protein [Peptoniphilus rachelemmaiella]|uniref:integrase DNA-binding domain-containing protein n=1 Tax=Peptoniphilus rachelemmaiella TaxID=2811779 RepID=UPI002041201A|nr:tyrosine-type recombinase/integrase [Peptoniphilus rachelemmaiella]